MLAATRWGVGTSVDSAAYIQGARGLASGAADVSLVQHAPLYSMLLALGGLAGVDPLEGARWLNAAALGANIALVGVLARRATSGAAWAWLPPAILALVMTPIVTIHLTALSEPVFLACMLGGFLALDRHLDAPSPRRLSAAAVLLGLALLARYAGAACVLTAILAIVMGPRSWTNRLRDVTTFSVLALLPLAAWVIRNLFVASSATGRAMSIHPIGASHVWQALYTASGWLLLPPSAPNVLRLAIWGALLLAAGYAVAGLGTTRAGVPAAVRLLTTFVVVYAAFLATSISFLDANTPLDDRILLPALVALLVVGAFVADTLWPAVRRVPGMGAVALALTFALIAGHGVRAAELARASYRDGWGFTHRAWRESAVLGHIARLDPAVTVYSNAPEIVYLRTGREARALPRKRFLMNQQDNPAFASELGDVAGQVRRTCGVVAYIRGLDQKALPGEEELAARLGLDRLADTGDGLIWGVQGCR